MSTSNQAKICLCPIYIKLFNVYLKQEYFPMLGLQEKWANQIKQRFAYAPFILSYLTLYFPMLVLQEKLDLYIKINMNNQNLKIIAQLQF